jgi:hypothetical protein
MRRVLTSLFLAVALSGPAIAADAGVAVPAPLPPPAHPWHSGLPACDDPAVVATIPEKFAVYDANIIGSGLLIANIDGIYETGQRAGGPSLVDRRYCGAVAWLTNGQQNEVVYLIEGPKLGFASIGWHVESCLPGFDPYRVYDARCRSIRP